jgi:chromatin remodeling complex protein RSC6
MAPKKVKSDVPASAAPAATEPVPVAAPAPAAEPVQVVTEVVVAPQDDEDKFAVVVDTLVSFQTKLKDLLVTVKGLQKEYSKLQKQKGKKTRKAVGASGDDVVTKRTPSGFAKPTNLSNELCDFLSKPHGTSMARTEVTRIINEYIRNKNLQNPSDRRKILADDKLKSILNIDPEKGLSYFSLQASIKHHFTKIEV